jgi:hypothetical protein
MIYFLPWGGIEMASSRLRVHNIIPYIIPFLNASLNLPSAYQPNDILVIQKIPRIDELEKAKIQGAKVIYDIDDYYWDQPQYQKMIENADLVTVDTPAKAKILNAACIPNSLDWDGITGKQINNGIACWTSYGNNAGYLEGINIPYKLKLITTPDYKNYFTGKCEFKQWTLDTVDREIRESEIMIIRLPDEKKANVKSMHKLLKSWANGVPCYTSPMPDYVRAMQEAGVEGYLVNDWSKLKNIGFDSKCKEYALRYKAENVAKQWLKLFQSLNL